MKRFDWHPGMGQVSGFGGAYEDTCRQMIRVGVLWLEEHPGPMPDFTTYSNVTGLIEAVDDRAKSMAEVMRLVGNNPTGAMMQVAASTALFINNHGWRAYVKQMIRREARERGAP